MGAAGTRQLQHAQRPSGLPLKPWAAAACASLALGSLGCAGAPPRAAGTAPARAESGGAPRVAAGAEGVRAPPGQEPRYVSARAYRSYLAALLARERGDTEQAISSLREALLYDPRSPHLHARLAELLAGDGRVAAAEEEAEAALALDPRHGPSLLLAGRIAAARGRPDQARARFAAAADAQPRDADAFRELIRLEIEQGDPEAAARAAGRLEDSAQAALRSAAAVERALGEGPGLVAREDGQLEDDGGEGAARAQRLRESAAEGWAQVAAAFAQKHDEARAADAFARADAVDASDPEVIVAEAQYYESRRRFADARKAELKLLSQRPDAPEVLASLTSLSLEEGELDLASAYARKLLWLADGVEPAPQPSEGGETPRDDEQRELSIALLRAGNALLGARRSADALAQFEAALRLFPGSDEPTFYRALALQRVGRAREAIPLFDRVAARLSEKAGRDGARLPLSGADAAALALDARVQAALARNREGEGAQARRSLRALFAEHPLDEGVSLGLLEVFDRGGQLVQAEELFAQALQRHPRSETLLYALASAQDRRSDKDGALRRMRELLALAPEHAFALNYVGYSLAESGGPAELVEAQRLLSRAVELRPDDGAIADSYGFCLSRMGQPARALPELLRADKLNPGDPIILSHLGDAQMALGLRDEAARTFRAALQRLAPRPAAPRRRRFATAARGPGPLAEDDDERTPDPGDARVRSELEAKLRSLTAR